jgi:YD repeat-containing protein
MATPTPRLAGTTYAFDSSGNLTTSKPVSTKTKASLATNPYYRYVFDNNGRLQSVTDPIDRQVTFTWATEAGQLRLQTVHVWDGHDWQLEVDVFPALHVLANLGARLPRSHRVGRMARVGRRGGGVSRTGRARNPKTVGSSGVNAKGLAGPSEVPLNTLVRQARVGDGRSSRRRSWFMHGPKFLWCR